MRLTFSRKLQTRTHPRVKGTPTDACRNTKAWGSMQYILKNEVYKWWLPKLLDELRSFLLMNILLQHSFSIWLYGMKGFVWNYLKQFCQKQTRVFHYIKRKTCLAGLYILMINIFICYVIKLFKSCNICSIYWSDFNGWRMYDQYYCDYSIYLSNLWYD